MTKEEDHGKKMMGAQQQEEAVRVIQEGDIPTLH